MILINNKTKESYICTQSYVAYKIGVSNVTVWRWKTSDRYIENYNEWTVYLKPKKIKQKNRGCDIKEDCPFDNNNL